MGIKSRSQGNNDDPDDPFPDLVETVCINVCGRNEGRDAGFVAWLRKFLTAKLASVQQEHANWREKAESSSASLDWIRKKLKLPADAQMFSGENSIAGAMHVQEAHAHGYEKYIVAFKCNDKQGEIARLLVRAETAERERDAAIAEIEAADGLANAVEDYRSHVDPNHQCKMFAALAHYLWKKQQVPRE